MFMEYDFKGVLRIQNISKSNAVEIVGTISHYNGLLFNSITSLQADCEGALAVGGNAQFGFGLHGYDIGAAGMSGWESVIIGNHGNPEGYPSLLLGGIIDNNSTATRVYAGKVVMKLSNQQHYEENLFRFDCADGVSFVPDKICEDFFEYAKKQVIHTSDVLAQGSSEKITISDLQNLEQLELSDYENKNIKTDAKILCFNLDCDPGDSVKIGEIHLTEAMLEYDTIVINVPAEKITFADGATLYDGLPIQILPSIYPESQLMQDFASKLIFNFPNANEINMLNYAIIGSILAPNASVTGAGGSINGMLIADSLFQDAGMELHAFAISLEEELWGLTVNPQTANVEIVKRDSLSYEALPNAIFSLYLYNEETEEYDLKEAGLATSESGVLVIEELPIGVYKLVETQAPKGYALSETAEISFEIKTNNEGEIIQVNTIYISNAKLRGHVTFLKRDSEKQEIKLEGAIFSLFMYNTEEDEYELISSGLTTSEEGTLLIENLLPGEYKLVETKAPEGYYLSETAETQFTISLDQDGKIVELETINVANTKLGSVQIIKTDFEDAQITLAGALFTLKKFNAESDEYEELRTGLVTDEDGSLVIENLEPGKYMVVETKSPYGYKLPENPETLFTIEL